MKKILKLSSVKSKIFDETLKTAQNGGGAVSNPDGEYLNIPAPSPSPENWEDEFLYFLLPDRFSDGNEIGYRDVNNNIVLEGKTKMHDASQEIDFADLSEWQKAGEKWCGGTLKGLKSKLGYLKRLGVTGIWIAPFFQQVNIFETYHGYGPQNWLDVDKHLGDLIDIQELVDKAHKLGIKVIMDVIINHSGDVFEYKKMLNEDNKNEGDIIPWTGEEYEFAGFRAENGKIISEDEMRKSKNFNDGIWPREFQEKETFNRKGIIKDWDNNQKQYQEGDFPHPEHTNLLKAINPGKINNHEVFLPSNALHTISKVLKYWIAVTNIDAFRIDTVKHVPAPAIRWLSKELKDFAKSLSKNNFFLIAELSINSDSNNPVDIVRRVHDKIEELNLDAGLGINAVIREMQEIVLGKENPDSYFSLFTNQDTGSRWFRNEVVTMFDDHDQILRDSEYIEQNKGAYRNRLAHSEEKRPFLKNAICFNLTTLGIPCLYYGSEQGFDGGGESDRYLRECMFGGPFGTHRTTNEHFFDEENDIFQATAQIAEVRKNEIALRQGEQYLREISKDGEFFYYPEKLSKKDKIISIIAWSRIFEDQEIVAAMNTNPVENQIDEVWTVIDSSINTLDDEFICIFSSEKSDYLKNENGDLLLKESVSMPIKPKAKKGLSIKISVPSRGFRLYKRIQQANHSFVAKKLI